ncbi:MAG: cytochrome c3 family protein [Planctomycetota bacterium]|jgi:predicted CXXCH cytochrome family protein
MKIIFFKIMSVFLIMIQLHSSVAARIQGSPHDLSALSGRDTCDFCHTPHESLPRTPAWSHKLSDAVYTIYQSSSLEAKVGQPTGPSKMCLSCHDGTVALTHTKKGGAAGVYITPGSVNLGTDLSDDHPISFIYSVALSIEDPQIRPPLTLPEQLKLDKSNELQCTTCHNAHDNSHGKFLVMSNARSQMCTSCHDLSGWRTSIHESSTAITIGSKDKYLKDSQYHTVADNGCLSCHMPHSAGGHERLLHFDKSEDNCMNCHDGSVAQTNLRIDLSRPSRHDVIRYNGVHDLKETPMTTPMHVECVDCHNPHATQDVQTQAPVVPGSMRDVTGVTASGAATEKVQYEYEVCFKCHADNPNRIESRITRQITQANTRLEFDPSNPSFHPVVSSGVNLNVPSLKSPMEISSMIYCTSCHNSDSATGTKGPHGSNYPNLLAYQYETSDFTQEGEFSYELCYKCHSRNSILNDESFSKHSKHLIEEIPCSACHDPHGISSAQGTQSNNSHLINFDISIVSPVSNVGQLEFEDLGVFHGRCYLNCHGKSHSPEEY